MTIGMWVFVAILAFIGLAITIGIGVYKFKEYEDWILPTVASFLITAIVVGGVIGCGFWYYGNTAGGARALKDQKSALSNGLMREIVITAEDGREIFYYKGKCDIETNENYILFEDEQGYRQMVYWGELDTIVIVELPSE